MGINAPLPEGHIFFGERGSREFNPYSRELPNPGKGRLRLVEGHVANLDLNEGNHEIKLPVEVFDEKQTPIAVETVDVPEDHGRSEVEILMSSSPPPEYRYGIGDVF